MALTTNDLLEVAVVDESGAVLLDTLVRPRRRQAWPEAQAVHGIRPEDVASAPNWRQSPPSWPRSSRPPTPW